MGIDQEKMETLLEWALQWQDFDPDEGFTSSSGFESHKIDYALRKLTEETFPIHEMEVHPRDIKQDLLGIIQDLAIERRDVIDDYDPHYPVEESIDADGLISTYRSKVNNVVRDIGRSDKITTSFYFPMNIILDRSVDEINIFDIIVTRISETDWLDKIQQFEEYPDVSNTAYARRLSEGKDVTYWKAEIKSKGARYASEKFKTGINLLCAKINHCHYLWNVELDNRSQWSSISEPFSVLIAIEDTPREVTIIDDEPKAAVDIDWNAPEFRCRYEEFPSFEYGSDGTEEVFQNALLEYQRAMVETNRHSGFMTFWRCIEGLSQAGEGEKGEIVERAKWALKNVKDNVNDDFIDEITDQIYESRNKWVHEPNWNDIWMSHEYVAKYLSDAMIQMYAREIGSKELDIIRNIFNIATMERPQRDEKYQEAIYQREAIEVLRQIESTTQL